MGRILALVEIAQLGISEFRRLTVALYHRAIHIRLALRGGNQGEGEESGCEESHAAFESDTGTRRSLHSQRAPYPRSTSAVPATTISAPSTIVTVSVSSRNSAPQITPKSGIR